MNIEYDKIQAFKRLSLPEILTSYSILLKPKGPNSVMALCPFHDDRSPSLSVSQRSDGVWLWHCFACRMGGTTIDFVMRKENLTLQETYAKLKDKIVTPTASVRADSPNGNGHHSSNPLELLKAVTDFYHKTLFEDKRGVDYLRERGLKSEEIYRSFKVGFVNGQLRKNLSYTSPTLKDLKSLGILNDEGNEFFYNSIVIPLLDEDGNVVSLYGRNITRKSHLYLKGSHRGLVNRQGAFDTQKIILTEAVLDALSLYELGIRNCLPCYGTGGFTEDHKALLTKKRIKEVELCFDNDKAGESGAEDLAAKLTSLGIQCSRINLPEGIKDPNDFLISQKTKEDFKALERIPIEAPKTLFDNISYEIQKEKGMLHLKAGGRSYRVLLPEFDSSHSLRVNIKLQMGEEYHIDVLDLYSERQRKSYSKRISQKFSLEESLVEYDLYQILKELEKESTKILADPTDIEEEISEQEKEEALSALKSSSLIKDIIQDLEKIGCVGEDASKLLGYLVTISRRLDQTLSMIIVSQSGAGKSNLADTLESIVPKDECVHLSRITPQALYYMEKDSLKRKVLIIEEKEGSEQADYSLRVLQSKQVLRLAVPMKDSRDGKMKTTTFEVEGPVVVIETTTKHDHNPENTSRCFQVYMDESESQTKKIHAFQRLQKTLEGARSKKEAEKIKRKHQVMQKLLKPLIIHIPFIEHIKFPSRWMRTRRDYPKFLSLIEAVSFLHQHQRDIKKDSEGFEYIEATLEDYQIAYKLSKDIFGECFEELKKPEKEFSEQIKRLCEEERLLRFTCRQIRERSGLPDYLVRRYLDTLVRMEYLFLMDGKNGVRFEYQINPHPIQVKEIVEGLTTPEELEGKLLQTFSGPFMTDNSNGLNKLRVPFDLLGKRL